MTKYICVKNWEEFQHYSNRTPPWIKLHNSLLDDYEFECLTDIQKGHLLCIWMLASRTGNKIPNNPTWVKKKIGASSNVDLQALIDAEFLCYHDASKLLHNEEQIATQYVPPEEERREEETENNNCESDDSEIDKSIPPTFNEVKDLYNEVFPMLPQCKEMTDSRITKIRGMIRTQLKTIEDWSLYFNYVKTNCTWVLAPKPKGGQNNLDWFLRQKNYISTKEGSYDDRD